MAQIMEFCHPKCIGVKVLESIFLQFLVGAAPIKSFTLLRRHRRGCIDGKVEFNSLHAG